MPARKPRTDSVTCLDCRVECSPENRCPCCVRIERDMREE